MRPRIVTLAVTATLLATPAAVAPGAADALAFAPCAASKGFSCATLSVPLDRSGSVPGSVALSMERLQVGASPSRSAVVALAGGPGQAAVPLARDAASAMAPALASRDLIVFDQRGTGASGPLRCPSVEGAGPSGPIGPAFERCALQIGAARGAYTTQESVADIEAIRQATGYEKLVLYGVSYGTKVALEYAERYPQHVEALVLDSVVPTGVSDPFGLASFAAIGPMLADLCEAGACAGITADPLGDLARLAAGLRAHALRGSVFDGSGHRHRASLSELDLFDLIGAGDLNPALRALLPAAVQSALRGDPDPLLRLNLLSEGLIPNLPGSPLAGSDGVDEALFLDTTCEEEPFPWQRSAPPATKLAEALAALHALAPASFFPFDASTAWRHSPIGGCAHWPSLAPAPPPAGALPDVPTLILSGAQDIRTPTSFARQLAARIPGAQLLVVPHTGHSVLGTDFSGCAQEAVRAFFSGVAVAPCRAAPNLFAPTPLTPRSLRSVQPVPGVPARPGRTLAVVLETIVDLERQVVGATLQSAQALPSGSSFGGLRGGYARLSSSALSLHRMSLVQGVRVSGVFRIDKGRLQSTVLRVDGTLASPGRVRVGSSPLVSGVLGGRRFSLNLAKVRLASDGGGAPAGGPRLDVRFRAPALARAR
jgi:pimeloyl-ACP methyl ester carboxylesterase